MLHYFLYCHHLSASQCIDIEKEKNFEWIIIQNQRIISLLFFLISASRYPYPAWGSPYQSADHYWPMSNITDGILEDVEGAAHTVVHNDAKIVQDPQLGYTLSLDGKDDWVDTGKYKQLTCGMSDVIS